MGRTPRIAILPDPPPEWLAVAVRQGGGKVVEAAAAEALVWDAGGAAELDGILADLPGVRWVQLSWAGVDRYVHLIRRGRLWTYAKDVYGPAVAEHALALALAGFRELPRLARERSWTSSQPRSLFGARVAVVGGGSIGRSLLALLEPFGCAISVVRRSSGAGLLDAIAGTDAVFLAVPLTPETDGMIGQRELRAMGSNAWLINVARGRLVQTEALVRALAEGWIAGAAVDVTEPEPLPEAHPLWSLPNCFITPHSASIDALARAPYAALVTENVRRFAAGEGLLGLVDPDRGY